MRPIYAMHSVRSFLLIVVVLVFTLMFSGLQPVRAAEVVGDGTPASCKQKALRTAVKNVNAANGGTITFNCGTEPRTILLTSQLIFNKSSAAYVIDSGGLITLDGQNRTRVLYTASGLGIDLTVQNLSIINGYAGSDAAGERAANQGGGIYSGYRNSLTIQNVTFQNNRALANRHPYHGGGAIAVDTTSTVLIEDSTFLNNRSPNGGAINNLLSVLTIRRSKFQGNVATSPDPGGGGAIYNDAGKLTIVDSHIWNNTTANLGGGIFTWAHDVNGAFSGPTVIRNTTLANNRAEHGGGLWKGGAYVLELTNSSVTGNIADTRGAGISGTGPGKNFDVLNSTIAHNKVLRTGSAAGIFSANNTSTITNSTIAFNTVPFDAASVGAAIHGNVTLTRTIIAYNTGGWTNQWGCMGNITNGGNNLQYPGDTCGGGIPVSDAKLSGMLVPLLGTLTFGQTQILGLKPDSPAIDAASNGPDADQRGVARPFGANFDIGAVEMNGSIPTAPTLTSPTDGGVVGGTDISPTITWSAVDGATAYQMLLRDGSGKRVIKTLLNAGEVCTPDCAYSLATAGKTLVNKQTYKLSLTAINELGGSKANFTFTAQFPGKATLVSPDVNATVGTTPTFSWLAVNGAVEYRLIFKRSATGIVRKTAWLGAATVCTGDDCTYTLTGGEALKKGKHVWRVEARNQYGKQKSVKRKLTVKP